MAVLGPPVSLAQAAAEFSVEAKLSVVRVAAGLPAVGGLAELAGLSAGPSGVVTSSWNAITGSTITLSSMTGAVISGYAVNLIRFNMNPEGTRYEARVQFGAPAFPWSAIYLKFTGGPTVYLPQRYDGSGITQYDNFDMEIGSEAAAVFDWLAARVNQRVKFNITQTR